MAKKFATFDSDGALLLRFDSACNEIPPEAIEIEGNLWIRMIVENDGIWTRQADGSIIKAPLPSISLEVLSAYERAWRDAEVLASEWLVNRHRDEQDMQVSATLTTEQFSELLAYRQALRDWPQAELFPQTEQRPVAPAWSADLVM